MTLFPMPQIVPEFISVRTFWNTICGTGFGTPRWPVPVPLRGSAGPFHFQGCGTGAGVDTTGFQASTSACQCAVHPTLAVVEGVEILAGRAQFCVPCVLRRRGRLDVPDRHVIAAAAQLADRVLAVGCGLGVVRQGRAVGAAQARYAGRRQVGLGRVGVGAERSRRRIEGPTRARTGRFRPTWPTPGPRPPSAGCRGRT